MRRHVGALLAGCGVGRLVICFLVAVAAAAGVMVVPTESRAALLAPTPYMGWNTYYGVRGGFDETTIKSVASSLISSGLAKAGYRIVWLDFGWATGARDAKGQLTVDPTQWPDGMAGLTSWLHQQGLEAGIYTDAGSTGCHGQGVGSYGHYQQDADTFAAWGFDAVKVDFCGAAEAGLSPQPLYTQFAAALSNNASHRPMLLNVDNFLTPGQLDGTNPSLADSVYDNYQWSPQIAQSWRTDTDIGFPGTILFSNVLRNLDDDAAHPEAAGPGHWNDPDYLGPELGMTATEAQSQFSMWAILAAPLILGSDPRTLSAASVNMLENPNVIAVDQDPLGAQGTLVQQIGQGQVWAKPLANGDSAVALLNRGTTALQITTTASTAGLRQAGAYTFEDLWTNSVTTTGADGTVTALVPAHGVTLYRVVPGHTLTVSVLGAGAGTISGPGISCPGACSASYPAGTSVTLTATPAAGSRFGAWLGGGCPAAGSGCTVTLSSDVTENVAFDLPRSGTAYVVDRRGNTVTPVDLATNTTEHTIRGFDGPRAIAIAPDGGTAYVVDAGDGAITPINLATNRTEPAIRGFVHPGPIAVSPNGKSAYVLEDGRRLVPVDLVTDQSEPPMTFAKRSGVGTYARSIAIAPDGKTAYLGTFTRGTRATGGKVAAVDLATGNVRAVIRGFADPTAIAVTPNGAVAYVADSASGNVTPINVGTKHRIAAPALTARGAFPGANDLAITPDGKTVYVATSHLLPGTQSSEYGVGVIDTATNTELFAGLAGLGSPSGVAIAPDGRAAYLTGTGSVVPVDVATNTERPALSGFGSPTAIAITVPPPPNYSAKLAAQPRIKGNGVSDKVTCSSPTTSCTTIQVLTVTESVAATARAGRHRTRQIVLVVGARILTIRPHRTARVTIGLNSIGRQLLKRSGSVAVTLSLAIRRSGHTDTLTTSELTI